MPIATREGRDWNKDVLLPTQSTLNSIFNLGPVTNVGDHKRCFHSPRLLCNMRVQGCMEMSPKTQRKLDGSGDVCSLNLPMTSASTFSRASASPSVACMGAMCDCPCLVSLLAVRWDTECMAQLASMSTASVAIKLCLILLQLPSAPNHVQRADWTLALAAQSPVMKLIL